MSAVAQTEASTRSRLRYLFLAHRYLGIVIGLLMAMWCLSGVVMMYVPYPSLAEAARTAALAPLDLRECCRSSGAALSPNDIVDSIRVEMRGPRAIARVLSGGRRQNVDLQGATAPPNIVDAMGVARLFGARRGLAEFSSVMTLWDDQWTVSEEFASDRPLYKFSWNDAERTELYVSSVSGEAVQWTNAPIRFWNWFGAVPHWVYFTALRRHGAVWAQVIILTSLTGCFLTATGIYLGALQYRRRPAGRVSPYRGFMMWHHIPGLLFGVFALTWVLSGLLSVNPWGLLEGGDAADERLQLEGASPRWSDVQAALARLGQRPNLGTAGSLRSTTLQGKLYFVATYADGHRVRWSADGLPAALSEGDRVTAARVLGGPSQPPPQLLAQGDDYYFSRPGEELPLPVYRVLLSNKDRTRYYLDSLSAQIVMKMDGPARGYRWLHGALHRLDFASALRTRPLRDIVMIALLLGASVVTTTGCYAALRRVWRSIAP